MIFPSLLFSIGLLLLSATFCFSLDRTFRLGSDANKRNKKINTYLALELLNIGRCKRSANNFVVLQLEWNGMDFITKKGFST